MKGNYIINDVLDRLRLAINENMGTARVSVDDLRVVVSLIECFFELPEEKK